MAAISAHLMVSKNLDAALVRLHSRVFERGEVLNHDTSVFKHTLTEQHCKELRVQVDATSTSKSWRPQNPTDLSDCEYPVHNFKETFDWVSSYHPTTVGEAYGLSYEIYNAMDLFLWNNATHGETGSCLKHLP